MGSFSTTIKLVIHFC